MIDYSIDADGIASITWNMTSYPMNVLNMASIAAFTDAGERAMKDPAVKGVIITSARSDFIAGADLKMMLATGDPQAMTSFVSGLHRLLRRIETCGKPFVAAINGSALGGGYEISLACHYRIAADNPKALIGLPEVTIGLFPGGGGTQRLSRLIGIRAALPFLLEGRKLDPRRALEHKLVEQVVAPQELLAEAKRWLLEQGPANVVKPWDKKGFVLPGGAVQSPAIQELFTATNAMVLAKTCGNYPAPLAILSCVYEGCQTDIDNGIRTEIRYFAGLGISPQAKSMIRTQFFAIGEANKLATRPRNVSQARYSRIGVLGAGMMGAGIAHIAAAAGLEVVLLDTSTDTAQRGKTHSAALLDKKFEAGRITRVARDAQLALIRPTADYADLAGCELVIEAVFEDSATKAEVTQRAQRAMAPDAVFASTTSTLPITGLAQTCGRPENFIGLHFLSPVDKMPLVEIIRGERTGDACLARTMDFVKRIRKTPIVVNDSEGFYTGRVFSTYIAEGMAMLAEGVKPALIENAGRHAGMPLGPLALADEISIELAHRIHAQTAAAPGAEFRPVPMDHVAAVMVEKLRRTGRKTGQGFYDYSGQDKRLWLGLAGEFPLTQEQPGVELVKRRLLYVQSLEAARCLEQRVVFAPLDADVGAVLGWGFPAYLGGPIGQIHTIGIARFIEQCEALAARHGARFAPPALLKEMMASGQAFYEA